MLGIQVTCITLVSLYVQVFIPSVNEHCDHYLVSDYLFDQAMIWFLTPSLLDHIMLTLYAFHAFLHTMIMCIVVFQEFHVHMIQVLHSF